MSLVRVAKRLTPHRVKRRLRAAHRQLVFRRALARLANAGTADAAILRQLHYGWRNAGWSSSQGYLAECLRRVTKTRGPVLECGSGLSTLAMGVLAERSGVEIWSLEHDREWAFRVERNLVRLGLRCVHLERCPLVPYGGFDWYRVPEGLPREFGLVICDGPPGDTRGGREGFLHVMADRLCPGAIVLLDDAVRPAEQELARRLHSDLGATVDRRGQEPYFVAILPS